MACGLLVSFLVVGVGGKVKVFFWVSLIVPGGGFVFNASSSPPR
jgi:hypothetical protein